ncbi:MAG: hypothetical protein MJ219_03730 [Mycoplasmoidaceae bacterium]|nr:hypothetical protein [Mycoplasmoidaceae bacterium]
MNKIKTVLKTLTPIIATSAILAPTLTSCSVNTQTTFIYTTNNLDWVPARQTKLAKIRNLQATKEYFKNIDSNKQVLADDLGYFQLLKNRKQEN